MAITLAADQQAWIDDRVSSGEFVSTEDAVRSIVQSAMLQSGVPSDLTWAKPFLDEAIAEEDRGEIVTMAERDRRLQSLLASLSA